MTNLEAVPRDAIGRASCAYCRTEFDATRPKGCPICAVMGRGRRRPIDTSPKAPSEEVAS